MGARVVGDVTVVDGREFADDVEAEAGVGGCAVGGVEGVGVSGAVVAVEDAVGVGCGDAGSVVEDGDDDVVAVRSGASLDVVTRVLRGVRDEVAEDLVEVAGVTAGGRVRRIAGSAG